MQRLTPHEELQLGLDGAHRIAGQEDAKHRQEIKAEMDRKWPAFLVFIDQLEESA